MAKDYKQSTKDIVAKAFALAEEKREAGWTRDDFVARLKQMLDSNNPDALPDTKQTLYYMGFRRTYFGRPADAVPIIFAGPFDFLPDTLSDDHRVYVQDAPGVWREVPAAD